MVNRANGTRANDHRANGNRADVVAPVELSMHCCGKLLSDSFESY